MIAYWLIPAAPMRDFFTTLIADLAQRFDAPLFEPHLSVYVEQTSPRHAARVVREVAAEFGPIQLSVAGVRFSEEYWKTLFVQFFTSAVLNRLSDEIQSRSATASAYHIDPHLSVIYQTMRPDEKNKLAASLQLPFDEVVFESIAAVTAPDESKTPAGVASWAKVAERRLQRAGV